MNPRRAPLRRYAPLRRTSWLRPLTARRLSKRTSEERAFTAWIHSEPCAVRYLGGTRGCEGPIEQNHLRKPGLALKCSDMESAPFCRLHHQMWTDHTGVFAGWTKELRHHLAETLIEEMQRRWVRHRGAWCDGM